VLRYCGLVEEYFELSGYIVECWLPLHHLYQRAQGFGCSVGLCAGSQFVLLAVTIRGLATTCIFSNCPPGLPAV